MKSNYKRLGGYIRQVDKRNKDLTVTKLMGVSIQKIMIPSIANIIGTDMSTYKIVKKHQFSYGPVTSRNGEKVSIALSEDNECIISSSYTVFEIIDTEKLLPQYLMLWFKRPEFDRYARFMSHGSVREIFGWDELCDVTLPVPSIEKQQQIVDEYNVLENRIKLNETLNQKLEETAQSLYKRWFVDFEFPNEQGLPYKSSGGEMMESELGEVPLGWTVGKIIGIIELIDGDRGTNYPSQGDLLDQGHCLFLNAGNVTKTGFDFSTNKYITKKKDNELRKGKLKTNDIVLTTRGTVGNIAFYNEHIPYDNIRINSGMVIIRGITNEIKSSFIYRMFKSEFMKGMIEAHVSGSAQPQLPIKDIQHINIVKPIKIVTDNFCDYIIKIEYIISDLNIESLKLRELTDLLLSKLATVEG